MDNSTPISGTSLSGKAKLDEITENAQTFIDFLKFHGRVFKHSVTVSLEFFTQKPEAKFIATSAQWAKTGRTVVQGSEAIHFSDGQGRTVDMYDFSQIEESEPPYQWTVSKNNISQIKAELDISENQPLISGLISKNISINNITDCMRALNIPPQQFTPFSRSYMSAVQLIIAGRLEIGGGKFSINPDLSALKMLKTPEEKVVFFAYTSSVARKSLLSLENTIENLNIAERSKQNDLREMADLDRGTAAELTGGRISGDTAGTVEKQSDFNKTASQGRDTWMGIYPSGEKRKQHEVVSNLSLENDRQLEDVVQVRSDMGTLSLERDRGRADNGRRTDRELWFEMDGVYGDELHSLGRNNENEQQVPDSSTFSGQPSVELSRDIGERVRENESASYSEFREDSRLGTGEAELRGQFSDEGESINSDNRVLIDKLDSFFSIEENKNPSTNEADGYVLSDEDRLVALTDEISEKKSQLIDHTQNNDFNAATILLSELTELQRVADILKEQIQAKEILIEDVAILRSIEPKRKSIQNMLDIEVSRTPKFEQLLKGEFGEKSAYEARKGNLEWLNDDNSYVPVLEIEKPLTLEKGFDRNAILRVCVHRRFKSVAA